MLKSSKTTGFFNHDYSQSLETVRYAKWIVTNFESPSCPYCSSLSLLLCTFSRPSLTEPKLRKISCTLKRLYKSGIAHVKNKTVEDESFIFLLNSSIAFHDSQGKVQKCLSVDGLTVQPLLAVFPLFSRLQTCWTFCFSNTRFFLQSFGERASLFFL